MSSTFLQLQSADVVAQNIDQPRRILRLEAGSGVTFSVAATTNVITAQIASSGGQGSSSKQVSVLTGSTSFLRRDGVVVAGAFVYNASDYTGNKTMRTILASADGAVVRARIFDFAGASYVSGASLTTSSASPTILESSNLTLASTNKLYELHLDVSGSGDDDDQGLCSFCEIRSS